MASGSSQLEQLQARIKVTTQIAEAINRSLELDAVLETTLDKLLELFEVDSGIIVVQSRAGSLRIGCARGLSESAEEALQRYSDTIITTRKTTLVSNIQTGALTLAVEKDMSCFASVVSVPIWSATDNVGVLHLCARVNGFFSQDAVGFLEQLAHIVGVAITNAMLYRALTNELRSSKLTNEIARQITEGSLEVGQLLGRAAASLTKHFELVYCRFFIIDALRTHLVSIDTTDATTGIPGPIGATMVNNSGASAGIPAIAPMVASTGTPGNPRDRTESLRIQMRVEPILASVLRERKAVSSDDENNAHHLINTLGLSEVTIAVIPLVTNGRVIGVAITGRPFPKDVDIREGVTKTGAAFTRNDLERMETVAAYVAGALENSRLYQESLDLNRDLIELDAVTQLAPSVEAPEHTVRQLLEKAVAGTGSEAGAVYIGSETNPFLSLEVSPDVQGTVSLRHMRMASAARVAASERRSVELRLPIQQVSSLLAVPLRSVTDTPGSLVLFKSGALEERDRRLCSVVGDRIASILDNARLFETTRQHLEELTKRNNELVSLNKKNIELTDKLQQQLDARKREAQLAADIQKSLLVDSIPQAANLDIAVSYLPLEEASGDYYDVFKIDEYRMGIVITDAVGHGVPAAFVGGFSKMLLDVYKPKLAEDYTPADVLRAINRHLCSYGHNQLMTMFFGLYDKRDGYLRYSNGGHPLPVLFGADSTVTPLESSSHIMGAWDFNFTCSEVVLKPGDRLLFYTDGLIEAQNASGCRLGKRAVLDWFSNNINLSSVELNRGLCNLLTEFTNGRIDHDDVTVLTVVVLDSEPSQGVLQFNRTEDLTDAWMAVKERLVHFAYDSRAQYSVRLALEESMINAVKHGCSQSGTATLSYRVDGNACRLIVKDEGPGFNPDAVPDPTSPDKLTSFGGRGVFMIRRSVDEAYWNSRGNEVTLIKLKSRNIDILMTQNVEVESVMAEELKVMLETVDNGTVLNVNGPVDALSAPMLGEGIDDLLIKRGLLVIDLEGVSFLGSAAVSILVKAFSVAKEKDVKLILVKPADRDVSEMLDILGLLSVFPVVASRDEAVQQAG